MHIIPSIKGHGQSESLLHANETLQAYVGLYASLLADL